MTIFKEIKWIIRYREREISELSDFLKFYRDAEGFKSKFLIASIILSLSVGFFLGTIFCYFSK